jgi:hypothetical protein
MRARDKVPGNFSARHILVIDMRWGLDGWQEVREQDTAANPLGLHVLQIDTSQLRAGRCLDLSVTTRSRRPG